MQPHSGSRTPSHAAPFHIRTRYARHVSLSICRGPHICSDYRQPKREILTPIRHMGDFPSNTTHSNPSFHWVEGPKVRGTLEIFNLCLSTLIICIWNSLHPDMPLQRYSSRRRLFCNIWWMGYALLAPEIVLMHAIMQRMNASALAKRAVDQLSPQSSPQPGMLTRLYNYYRRRGQLRDVSVSNTVA